MRARAGGTKRVANLGDRQTQQSLPPQWDTRSGTHREAEQWVYVGLDSGSSLFCQDVIQEVSQDGQIASGQGL